MRCQHCGQDPCILQTLREIIASLSASNKASNEKRFALYQAAAGALGLVQREVLPACVTTRARELFPNPAGTPYVGYKAG